MAPSRMVGPITRRPVPRMASTRAPRSSRARNQCLAAAVWLRAGLVITTAEPPREATLRRELERTSASEEIQQLKAGRPEASTHGLQNPWVDTGREGVVFLQRRSELDAFDDERPAHFGGHH